MLLLLRLGPIYNLQSIFRFLTSLILNWGDTIQSQRRGGGMAGVFLK